MSWNPADQAPMAIDDVEVGFAKELVDAKIERMADGKRGRRRRLAIAHDTGNENKAPA